MKINILLPYKEKFDENKASSVSITVRNNLFYSIYSNQIKIFGQNVDNPLFKENFVGLKYSILSLKSKNEFLVHEMLKIISQDIDKNQLIEIHNRPYLLEQITKRNKFPISLFFHNDPQTMKGSKTIRERENILSKCAAIFCVSEFIKKKFLEGVKENFQKVHVLYNGVERKLKKFPIKKKEILFVGRLVIEKGAHLFVDAIKDIAQKYPEWSFAIIGSFKLGDNKHRNFYSDDIIKKMKAIGLQAQFYGFKNQEFVEAKMKSASIIVIPSIWEEPFGLVAAEAMSNGACILASKVGGIPEIVKNNGILINNINLKKLSSKIDLLIKDNKLRENYQRKAWENFEFSSETSSQKLDHFRELISSKYF
ncbi:glycosyltransferase family 4 protein [Alphaproteobacteria bacterium]|nr:glycosyltransferase family 4 protein [Alphaproteobacteria bacterium]